jgi:preprotein translocase subunit SecD
MMIRVFWFNTYLLAIGALALAAGCRSDAPSGKPKYGKNDHSSLRLFLEVNQDGSDRTETVTIGRERPFPVHVEKQPFLTEVNIEKSSIVEALGGFSIAVQFDKEGGWLLEQYTTGHKGRRLAVAAEFGQMRWLAAPRITGRIADGRLEFTPDATRDEAERIVHGLNRVAELVAKGRK